MGRAARIPIENNVARMDSHGGWLATAEDLVRFALHVDGFPEVPDILGADSLHVMTTPSAANRRYAKGWRVDGRGNWWHTGRLPGTWAIVMRTAGGMCWAALTNSRLPGLQQANPLESVMGEMLRCVPAWRT